jgi:hypothetical protein
MAASRGPRGLGRTSLALALLGSKLGLPPQGNVVFVTTIYHQVLVSDAERRQRNRLGVHSHMAYGSAWPPLPAAAAGTAPPGAAFIGALLVLEGWP